MGVIDEWRSRPRIRVWPTLGFSLTFIAAHLRTYLIFIAFVQAVIVLIIVPRVADLFDLLLVSIDVDAITNTEIADVVTNVWAVLLLVAIVLLAGLFVYVEMMALLILAHRHQSGLPVTVRTVLADLWLAVRRLASPQSLALLPYFFLLLPLGNIGVAAFLVRGIRVPDFISGELVKTDSGRWFYYGALAVIVFFTIRLFFTLSIVLAQGRGALGAMAESWRLTRFQGWRLLVLVGSVSALTALLVLGIATFGVEPTAWIDRTEPDAAPLVAGISLAFMQVAVFMATGFAAVTLAHVTVASHNVLAGHEAFADSPYPRSLETAPVFDRSRLDGTRRPTSARQKAARGGFAVVALVLFAGLSIANTGRLDRISDGKTQIIAHRGYVTDAVENTIPALDAAARFDPAYVEIDIQQTRDDKLVVIHDNSLGRLAGRSDKVSELTLAEATAVRLRQDGHTAMVPSLDEFIERAKALDVNLLIELKPHGGESPDFLDDVVETLDRHGVSDDYLVQSLDKGLVEELKRKDNRIRVGYVVPISFGHVPRTSADFVVIEDFSYSDRFRNEAWAQGLDVMVWTVNRTPQMRGYFRSGVNAIITDEPGVAKTERTDIVTDTSVSNRLQDAIGPLLNF